MDSVERLLHRIEQEWQDDLELIMEITPEPFPTEMLLNMKERCRAALANYRWWSKLFFYTGVSSPLFLLTGALLALLGQLSLGFAFLVLSPISLLTFLIGNLVLNIRSKDYSHLSLIESIINGELQRRKSRTPFKSD